MTMKKLEFNFNITNPYTISSILFFLSPSGFMTMDTDSVSKDILLKVYTILQHIGIISDQLEIDINNIRPEYVQDTLDEELMISLFRYIQYYGRPRITKIYSGVLDDIICSLEMSDSRSVDG